MRRIVRLKDKGALHTGNPVLGKLGCVEKSTRPFDPRELWRNRIRHLKLRSKLIFWDTSALNCSPVMPIRPQDIIQRLTQR